MKGSRYVLPVWLAEPHITVKTISIKMCIPLKLCEVSSLTYISVFQLDIDLILDHLDPGYF